MWNNSRACGKTQTWYKCVECNFRSKAWGTFSERMKVFWALLPNSNNSPFRCVPFLRTKTASRATICATAEIKALRRYLLHRWSALSWKRSAAPFINDDESLVHCWWEWGTSNSVHTSHHNPDETTSHSDWELHDVLWLWLWLFPHCIASSSNFNSHGNEHESSFREYCASTPKRKSPLILYFNTFGWSVRKSFWRNVSSLKESFDILINSLSLGKSVYFMPSGQSTDLENFCCWRVISWSLVLPSGNVQSCIVQYFLSTLPKKGDILGNSRRLEMYPKSVILFCYSHHIYLNGQQRKSNQSSLPVPSHNGTIHQTEQSKQKMGI